MTVAVVVALAQRPARAVLLGTVLLVAVCGFIYELVIVAMGTYLLGNSIEQVSLVLAAFVSSMGAGSLLSRPLMGRPVVSFALVECLVALIGGLSAIGLYAAFAYLDLYQPVMLLFAASIGLLVGCEIPLLVVLLQRVRRQETGTSVAELLAADYLGAVVGGVSFPLLLLPFLGQIDTALAVGALNLGAGVVVVWLLGGDLSARTRRWLGVAFAAVLAVLGATAALADRFEVDARQALYDDPIVLSERTRYQEIVLTRSLAGGDLRLFLNGDLQFSSKDEYRYHEALVHPAMAGSRSRVLVLGGGDGLAMREVLRYPDVREAVQVELDPRMLRLAREDERLRALNGDSLRDRRVRTVTRDAFAWLRTAPAHAFDVVIADFPDPDDAALAKLYSVELYGLVRRALAPGGRLVVQSGSPYFAQKAYWSIAASLEGAGLAVTSYHVDVPSFGDWGFHLAGTARPALTLDPPPRPLRFLDGPTLQAAAVFGRDRRRPPGDLRSTLDKPRIVAYAREGYRDY
ncbi:polyamine aminopropyltransferase [Conexibacter sp. W3-3-2]|uniref:polyamine aminopropyltransferase n=1 Tax=Conexibacter sp. W3-3-2 TaxID=2675227 RepID=UPI0012B6BF24|nr:polyamine aminopropyltransferase [Conexibacter sp. W3-3-2]